MRVGVTALAFAGCFGLVGCFSAPPDRADAGGTSAGSTASGGTSAGSTASSGTTANGSAQVVAIEWVPIDDPVVNLADSIGTKSLQLQFRLLDSSHSPVSDGVNVTFSLGTNHVDASLAVTSAKTANGTGLVSTTLNAGLINGNATVTATADNGVSGTTPPIPIQGGPPDLAHMAFACDNLRVAGFERSGLALRCSAIIGDRNAAFAPNVQVKFRAEAGTVSQAIPTTPDPFSGLGIATMTYQTGTPPPLDVDPNALDDGISTPNCALPGYPGQTGTCNPRDGWVTLIAYTAGDECYVDVNGNGKYDEGIDRFPPECDQGEPYVDANDNGQYDPPNETFLDFDYNARYTPANGKWDGADEHAIWRSTVIVWTGAPTLTATPTDVGTLAHCASQPIAVTLADVNGNLPAADGQADALFIDAAADGGAIALPAQISLSGANNAFSSNGYPSVDNTAFSFMLEDADGCVMPQPASPAPFSVALSAARTLDDSGVPAPTVFGESAITGAYQ